MGICGTLSFKDEDPAFYELEVMVSLVAIVCRGLSRLLIQNFFQGSYMKPYIEMMKPRQ